MQLLRTPLPSPDEVKERSVSTTSEERSPLPGFLTTQKQVIEKMG
ncbi:hypothetical protein [Microcoleus sp. PH2017_27_LUM_O_A]|nr:hypothetical protein [Microcoleus sp. PH2017_27_LUM_O_A]